MLELLLYIYLMISPVSKIKNSQLCTIHNQSYNSNLYDDFNKIIVKLSGPLLFVIIQAPSKSAQKVYFEFEFHRGD